MSETAAWKTHERREYTWDGDALTQRKLFAGKGTTPKTTIAYTYGEAENPFAKLPRELVWMTSKSMFLTSAKAPASESYVPASNGSNITYDVATDGGFVTTIKSSADKLLWTPLQDASLKWSCK